MTQVHALCSALYPMRVRKPFDHQGPSQSTSPLSPSLCVVLTLGLAKGYCAEGKENGSHGTIIRSRYFLRAFNEHWLCMDRHGKVILKVSQRREIVINIIYITLGFETSKDQLIVKTLFHFVIILFEWSCGRATKDECLV